MAIAYDNDTLNTNTANSTGETFSHTCAGSGLTLVVFVMLFGAASNSSSSAPTYNGVSMTQKGSTVEYNYQLNRYFNLEVYYLNNPATGANNVVTAYSGTASANAVWAASYTGANNGVGTNTGSSTGNDNNPTVTFTTDNSTGLILSSFMEIGADSDPFTPDGSETERQDTDTGGGSTTLDFGVHCMELAATGGSDTLSSTATVSDHWLALAVEINAAAGATYTLTADAGSFALTGQTASLLANRLLTAAAGSFTLTGQDASLLVNRLLTADAGSYTLTGQDASLLAGRVLTAAAGSFVLSGQDATLTYNPGGATYTLTADVGSFALTGQAAGLVVNRLLTGEAGAFVLTGQDASLLVNRLLTADAGSYTLTGQDASLLASYLLTAETGSYTLTGQTASFVVNIVAGIPTAVIAIVDTYTATATVVDYYTATVAFAGVHTASATVVDTYTAALTVEDVYTAVLEIAEP